jgi:hypothetical protein
MLTPPRVAEDRCEQGAAMEPNDVQDALLADLRTDAEQIPATLSALAPETLTRGAYEQGWTGREIVAHIASIEWTYARLIERARKAADAKGDTAGGDQESGSGTVDMNDYNARQIEKRQDASVAELIDEFRANRTRTIAAVEQTPSDLFAQPMQSAGGVRGSLADVIRAVAIEHVRGHVEDLSKSGG